MLARCRCVHEHCRTGVRPAATQPSWFPHVLRWLQGGIADECCFGTRARASATALAHKVLGSARYNGHFCDAEIEADVTGRLGYDVQVEALECGRVHGGSAGHPAVALRRRSRKFDR